jgi:hypothetical protein
MILIYNIFDPRTKHKMPQKNSTKRVQIQTPYKVNPFVKPRHV